MTVHGVNSQQSTVNRQHHSGVTGNDIIPKQAKPNRQAGSAKGMVWMSDDFDEPLEEFKE
ncbi:DUF2281 domain-containing protein [Microcoleus sp. MON2_D5]|uniref:DUF2281 domain-containing protein n=1 Tax=Microcoleus sp. MON2_D5 TaxID=2818833 RepID=UPI002FD550B6